MCELDKLTAEPIALNDEGELTAEPIALNDEGESKEDPPKSFSDRLYEEISSVIGGNNPNQFFCMGLPGTLIEAHQYSYDIEHNEPKPAHVKANESKLVNKLFDACTMSASDNGQHLQTQYKTVLDTLTPKLNGKLFDAKIKLRKVLMTPYPYNFGDESTDVLTLEQVFYRLYGDYVNAKQEWAKKQLTKKNELAKKYPEKTNAAYVKREDEFLDWYHISAEAEVLVIEEKLGKVLGVFSPGDMAIISGILDSGVGREISEARTTVANVGEMDPSGGYIFPVTLYPENWFSLLDNSFTAIDLLESPAALSQQLSVLTAQRSNITANLNSFLELIPKEEDVIALKKAYEDNNAAFQKAFTELQKVYTNVTVTMIKMLIDVMASTKKEKAKDVDPATTRRIFGVDEAKAKEIVDAMGESAKDCLNAQSDLIAKSQKATASAMEYFTKNNELQFKNMLAPLKQQLEEKNAEIEDMQKRIAISTCVRQLDANGKETDNLDSGSMVAPNHVPENFTQLIITSSMEEASKSSASESAASSSSYGVSFFFGGYSSNTSHKEAVSSALSDKTKTTIQIGMSVAKVQIGREWFNPGIFKLTTDMYNTSSGHISPEKEYQEFTPERFKDMNQCLFPCFPTAFVIARDVTIKFFTEAAMSTAFAQSVEDHSAKGGGFFIFSGSSSSSSSAASNSSKATSTANSVTVRFTNPQILGYYLEATPPDKSVSISSAESGSSEDFISIFEFITKFQEMLDDYASKRDEG